jgi:ribose/xylose/arabinose/galactoside ABC-type transport system permease subunit
MKIILAYKDVFALVLIGFIFHFLPARIKLSTQNLLTIAHPVLKAIALALTIYLVIQIKSADIKPFIYFQF